MTYVLLDNKKLIMSIDNYPMSWEKFANMSVKGDELFGKASKWSARFRLAKSFKSIDLGDDYSLETVKLYSAITKIFLTYSAFEQYRKVYTITDEEISQLQERCSQQEKVQKIRALDPNNAFCEFLGKYLTANRHKQKMQKIIAEGNIDIIFFAMSARHVFAHGSFAAHSTRLSAKRFEEISQIISDFLLDCMDLDFTDRVDGL
jgi:hypothetical protein